MCALADSPARGLAIIGWVIGVCLRGFRFFFAAVVCLSLCVRCGALSDLGDRGDWDLIDNSAMSELGLRGFILSTWEIICRGCFLKPGKALFMNRD